MQACTTELYITSICHQIIIHKCYLSDQVLTNINICFSPTVAMESAATQTGGLTKSSHKSDPDLVFVDNTPPADGDDRKSVCML